MLFVNTLLRKHFVNMADKYVSVRLYSSEKRAKEGNGNFTHKCLLSQVDKIKADQKTKNLEFRDIEKRNKLNLRSDLLRKDEINTIGNNFTIKPAMDIVPELTPFNLVLDEGTGNTTFILGSSKQGKTFCLMDIFEGYYADKNNISTLFSINSHIKLYGKSERLLRFPTDHAISPKYIDKYIKTQKRINSKTKNHYNFVNLFDDVIDVRFSKLMHNSILTYRNSNISTVICLQYNNLLAKQARSNVNNVILFGLNTDEAIKQAVDTYLKSKFKSMGIPVSDHIEFYKKLTHDHRFIYYRPSDNIISFHKISQK